MAVITHPLHPLAGKALPVLRLLRERGRHCVVVRFPDGRPTTLPLEWTDRRPWPPPLEFGGKRPKLHPASLREVRALVDELSTRGQKLDTVDEEIRVAANERSRDSVRGAAAGDAARASRRSRERAAQGRGGRAGGKR